jgi:hypothetical protein
MEAQGAEINNPSRLLPGGKQRNSIDGYQIPLDFKNGLPYLRCRKPTETELGLLPHIIMTSDIEWDPSLHDNVVEDLKEFHDALVDFIDHDNPFDQYGEYCFHTVATHSTIPEEEFFDDVMYTDFSDIVDDVIDNVHPGVVSNVYDVNLTDIAKVKPDFALLCTLFGWAPADTIKKTFDVTTNYARGRVSDTLKQHWRSRFPACNVNRRNKPVAADTVFGDKPADDSGVTAA